MPWQWGSEGVRAYGGRNLDGGERSQPTTFFTVRSQTAQARFAVELRMRFDPRDVGRLWLPSSLISSADRPVDRVADAANRVDGCLLVAPFLTRRAREVLEQAGWNYVDITGNVRIALERPPLFVRLEGEAKNPFREPQPLRSLKGPAAGRLVRALADFRPPYGVTELAARARTSAATASRVLAMLEADAIVERDDRGPVTRVNWKALLERWCDEYEFGKSNRFARYFASRGLDSVLKRLQAVQGDYAVTGTLVADLRKTVTASVAAYVYTRDVPGLARELDLVPAGRTTNVLFVEPFDSVVFERTWVEQGVRYVALSQAAADLLTSGDRNPQVGMALMEWMTEHELDWRT